MKPRMTDALARAAGHDAASRSMRKAGRKRWSRADYNRAVRTYNKAFGGRMAAALTRLAACFGAGERHTAARRRKARKLRAIRDAIRVIPRVSSDLGNVGRMLRGESRGLWS